MSFDSFLSDASSLETRSDDPSFIPQIDPPTDSIFQNTKEHCLMGIRGTVRRATDGWFVHTNVSFVRLLNPRRDRFLLISAILIQIDTDVIVWEGDAEGFQFVSSLLARRT